MQNFSTFNGKTISDLLLESNLISQSELQKAEEKAMQKNTTVENILRKEGLVTDDLLLQAINQHLGVNEEIQPMLPVDEKKLSTQLLTAFLGADRAQKIARHLAENRLRKTILHNARREENQRIRAKRQQERAAIQMQKAARHSQKSLAATPVAEEKTQSTFRHIRLGNAWKKRSKGWLARMRMRMADRRRKAEAEAKEAKQKHAEEKHAKEEAKRKKQEEKERAHAEKEAANKAKKEQVKQQKGPTLGERWNAWVTKKKEQRAQHDREKVAEREARKQEQERARMERERSREEAKKAKEEERARKQAERESAKKEREAEKARKKEEAKRTREQKRKEREMIKQEKQAAKEKAVKEKRQAAVEKKRAKEEAKRKKQEEKERARAEKAAAKAAKIAEKEERKRQAKMQQQKKIEERALSPEEKKREEERLVEDAKKEAMRQVLIEQEKAKLAKDQEKTEEQAAATSEQEKALHTKEEELTTLKAERNLLAEEKKSIEEQRQTIAEEKTTAKESAPEAGSTQKELVKERASLEQERAKLEAEQKQFAEEKKHAKTAIAETAEVKQHAAVSDAEKEEIRKKAIAEAQAKFETEKKDLLKQIDLAKQAAQKGMQGKEVSKEEREHIKEEAKKEAEEKLKSEKAALEEEKKKLQKGKDAAPSLSLEGMDIATTRAAISVQEKERIRQETLAEAEAKFEAQKQQLLKAISETKSAASKGGKGAIEDAMKELTQERAALETQKALIYEEAAKEAKAQFEKERTQWEIEKERIKQQATAEAQAEAYSQSKSKGLFGRKQKSALEGEIAKWKSEAEKLEKQRLELERARALQEEQERMRLQQQRIEEEKIRLEREKIRKEKEVLQADETHQEILAEEKQALEEEKKELEEEKQTHSKKDKKEKKGGFFGKGKKKKDKKAKSGKEGEDEKVEEAPSIDIEKILLSQNYIAEEELEVAKKSSEERHVAVEHILKEEGLVTKELIQNAIAEYYKMPFMDLGTQPPNPQALELLPEDFAATMHSIAVDKKEDGSLVIATSAPDQSDSIQEAVKKELPDVEKIVVVYTPKEAIESALSFYRKPLNTRFRKIIEEHKKIAPEIIEEIFADAIQLGASDIHFEPQEKAVVVRFRVDGVMHEAGRLPKEYYEGIVNRIKIAGNMRIDEHFAAQDGAIRWKSADRAMDVRVSIVPIVDGEKIVMRLLSEYVRTLTLRDLGFTSKQLDVLVKAAHKPFGMILTTGPTGSGKSTTLYGLMKIRNSPDVNISTIEDPVEYKIPGINHIQVNVKANLTFERGLRALVRQDPDIILVGEIRDDITAQISVNAALTGHLLFSTLHANDAATAVPRLLEMGIEPYLLASTLELLIAQRLMRRTCMGCRYSHNISRADACTLFPFAENYFPEDEDIVTLYKGKGCKACGGTGYKGRVGVYELMVITQEIEDLIVQRRTSGEINNQARKQGMLTLFEDGLEKVKSGLSTIEELLRIAAPPDVIDQSTPASNVRSQEE